jgi:hypothetical protein
MHDNKIRDIIRMALKRITGYNAMHVGVLQNGFPALVKKGAIYN